MNDSYILPAFFLVYAFVFGAVFGLHGFVFKTIPKAVTDAREPLIYELSCKYRDTPRVAHTVGRREWVVRCIDQGLTVYLALMSTICFAVAEYSDKTGDSRQAYEGLGIGGVFVLILLVHVSVEEKWFAYRKYKWTVERL